MSTTGIGPVIDALQAAGGIARVADLSLRTGRSPRAVRDLARRARLWQPFPSVVGLPRAHPSSRDVALAAVLQHRGGVGRSGHPDRDLVAVTRRSALALVGIQATAPSRVDLVVPAIRSPRPHGGVRILRSSHLREHEVRRHDGVPVVLGAGLVRDLAGVRSVDRLRADVIELRRAGWVELAEIADMLERCRCFDGRGKVRQLLAELAPVGRVDSPLELEARRRFRDAGIVFDPGQVCVPRPLGFPGRWRMHLDLGIAALRFGIEVDSFAYHASPSALRRDAQRANRVAALSDDWRVLRLTWADMDQGWSAFLTLTRQVIRAQAERHRVAAVARTGTGAGLVSRAAGNGQRACTCGG